MKQLDVKNIPLDTKVLIEASAGTGKTYTIGLLVLRLLLEKDMPIEKIVLITFMEAAALDLKKKTAEKILEAYDIWENDKFADDDLSFIIKKAKDSPNSQKIKVNLLDAIARIDEMPVFTIHGFCRKLLDEFMFETGNFEEREVVTNIDDIKEKVIADYWRENIKNAEIPVSLNPGDLQAAINDILNHSHAEITGEDYSEESIKEMAAIIEDDKSSESKKKDTRRKLKYAIVHKMASVICNKLHEEKKRLKVMYFSDMIDDCYNAVLKDKENNSVLLNAVRKRYLAIMVDEFQDTDRIQFEIFDYLFQNKPFFMIGDPKQAIYRFRGGDIFAYKEAREKAGENQFSMDTNYRSEKTLLDALNVFFSNKAFLGEGGKDDSLMGKGITYNPIKCGRTDYEPYKDKDDHYKPFVIWKGNYERDEKGNIVKIESFGRPTDYNKPDGNFSSKVKQAVIEEVKRLLNTGEFEPKDIAILLDSNNDCIDYKNALTKENIPSIVKGAGVFASDAALFLRILLNAVCYCNNIKFVRALILSRYTGLTPKDIDDKVFSEWSNVIYDTKSKWEETGVMSAIEYFLTVNDLWSSILNDVNGDRNITNIRQIIEILNQEEVATGKIPEKLNNRFAELCSAGGSTEELEEKLETDDDALKIMTIHKAKGLQFNIVFAPYIKRNPRQEFPDPFLYHDENNKEVMAYFSKNDHAKVLNNTEEKEETARILYVALTRAKYRVYVSFLIPGRNSEGRAHGNYTSRCREIFDDFCNSKPDTENIQIEDIDKVIENQYEYKAKDDRTDTVREVKRFSLKIEPSWFRTSFTGISNKLKHPEYFFAASRATDEPPAGKRMGTLLHSIFEDIEFDANDSDIMKMIEEKLGGYKEFADETGELKKKWILEKVKAILNKKLFSAGKLRSIDTSNKVTEINFFMNSCDMSLGKIKEIMGGKINEFETEDLIARYIKGAIDLVFLGEDGKYYILDWKSNTLSNYSSEGMEKEAMLPHGYHLQYYIYAVALKRWLEKTHTNFDFKKDFGGAFYIFIRGISEKENDYNGIYFASPEQIADDIIKLDNCFWRKG